MQNPPFTKAEVQYLVAAKKYIRTAPRQRTEGKFLVLEAKVFSLDTHDGIVPGGLLIRSRVVKHPMAGVPKAIPSASLMWHGMRIRGIDRYTRHENPDGTRMTGWHEHYWSELERDQYAVSIPEPERLDLLGLFHIGLKHWNIEVRVPQMETK